MDDLGLESGTSEFEQGIDELVDVIISLTALLNKNGCGEVLFDAKYGEETIERAIADSMDPHVTPVIEKRTSSDGKNRISVKVDGNNRPYACRGIAYIRDGEENRRMTMSELRRMFMSHGNNLIESISNEHGLTFNELIGILGEDDHLVRRFDLINSDGEFNLQGSMLSDQNPIVLTITLFSGVDRTVTSHRVDFSGHCLITLIRRTLDYIETLNETSVEVGEGVRKERKLFDMTSVREAWINACVHNNWLGMISPTIHVFDDRMEIVSFGPMPHPLSEEDMFEGISHPINASLMDIFVRTGLSKGTGYGIPFIVEHHGRGCIGSSNAGVTVTIPFTSERASASLRGQNIMLTDAERSILDTLRVCPHYTLNDVAGLTGLSRSYVGKAMMKLKGSGLVERKGSNKVGLWKVADR